MQSPTNPDYRPERPAGQRDRVTIFADVEGRAHGSDARTDEQVKELRTTVEDMLLGLITVLMDKGVITDDDLREALERHE